MDDNIFDLWLAHIDGVGPKGSSTLLQHFGNAKCVWSASRGDLLDVGFSSGFVDRLFLNRDQVFERSKRTQELCKSTNIRIFVKGSLEYPNLLQEAPDAPHILYVRGEIDFNSGHWLSVVGTRNSSCFGMEVCRRMVRQFKESFDDGVVVSGLAFGVDKCAHSAAVEFGVRTVAVVPGWVDDIVPSSHFYLARQIIEKGGAVVSDMHPGTVVTKNNFISRNRIIAALSPGTVVIESKNSGGSLVTANMALGYDRDLFAHSGDGSDSFEGNRNLIKNSQAILFNTFADISKELNWQDGSSVKREQVLGSVAQWLIESYGKLPDREFGIEEAAELLDCDVVACSRVITRLEMSGLLTSLHGRLYIKN